MNFGGIHTQKLFVNNSQDADSTAVLVDILKAAIELLSVEGNNFLWSDWENADEALAEVIALLTQVENGDLPSRLEITVLFAPTGPLQEVSLSSGWADLYLKVAERFDDVEAQLWGNRHG